MAKLWDKGYRLNEAVERFTVGRDFSLDRLLLPADAMASIAHARMLARVGLINSAEAEALEAELRSIARDAARGDVSIRREDEDGHTVIEARLIDRLGDTGKKVHTGRSRNDQVAAASRLYTRESLLDVQETTLRLVDRLLQRAQEEATTVMPGRTHMQVAMLSTLGLWFASWAEQLLDDLVFIRTAAALNDRSPLGSAASYGTPLPLDREFVAQTLGFASVQNNVLSVQHSRGSVDARVLEAGSAVGSTLARMAQDLILFSLPEIDYLALPEELCSGSSIMPQKRNPDVLELLRSRAGVVDGWATQCRSVLRNLPSGYNRDLQDTKEPLLRGLLAMEDSVAVATTVIDGLVPHREKMRAALNHEVFATDYAYELVESGVPFREAYRRAASEYRDQAIPDPTEALGRRKSTGTPGNLALETPLAQLKSFGEQLAVDRRRHEAAVQSVLGEGVVLRPRGLGETV